MACGRFNRSQSIQAPLRIKSSMLLMLQGKLLNRQKTIAVIRLKEKKIILCSGLIIIQHKYCGALA